MAHRGECSRWREAGDEAAGSSSAGEASEAATTSVVQGTPLKEASPSVETHRAPSSDSKCYTRRKRRKEIEAPLSCPPLSKLSRPKRRRVDENKENLESGSRYAVNIRPPLRGRERLAPCATSRSRKSLPKEFVAKQQEYFKEVDAFELQEAESGGSSSDTAQ